MCEAALQLEQQLCVSSVAYWNSPFLFQLRCVSALSCCPCPVVDVHRCCWLFQVKNRHPTGPLTWPLSPFPSWSQFVSSCSCFSLRSKDPGACILCVCVCVCVCLSMGGWEDRCVCGSVCMCGCACACVCIGGWVGRPV